MLVARQASCRPAVFGWLAQNLKNRLKRRRKQIPVSSARTPFHLACRAALAQLAACFKAWYTCENADVKQDTTLEFVVLGMIADDLDDPICSILPRVCLHRLRNSIATVGLPQSA